VRVRDSPAPPSGHRPQNLSHSARTTEPRKPSLQLQDHGHLLWCFGAVQSLEQVNVKYCIKNCIHTPTHTHTHNLVVQDDFKQMDSGSQEEMFSNHSEVSSKVTF